MHANTCVRRLFAIGVTQRLWAQNFGLPNAVRGGSRAQGFELENQRTWGSPRAPQGTDRHTDGHSDTDTETDRQTQTDRHTQTQTQTQTDRQADTERERQRLTGKETECCLITLLWVRQRFSMMSLHWYDDRNMAITSTNIVHTVAQLLLFVLRLLLIVMGSWYCYINARRCLMNARSNWCAKLFWLCCSCYLYLFASLALLDVVVMRVATHEWINEYKIASINKFKKWIHSWIQTCIDTLL